MKLALSGGTANVDVNFGTKEVPVKSGKVEVRTTEVIVTLPNGEKLTSTVSCDTRTHFVRREGRYAAILKLFEQDVSQACDAAVSRFNKQRRPKAEVRTTQGLMAAAREFYQLPRPDRTLVFRVVCPEFFRNTPERKEQRERSQYERLSKKYGSSEEVIAIETFSRLRNTAKRLLKQTGKEPTIEEAAKEAGISVDEAQRLLKLNRRVLTLPAKPAGTIIGTIGADLEHAAK